MTFWRKLLAEAALHGNQYSETMYWWLLEREIDDLALVDHIRSLVDRRLEEPAAAIAKVLQSAGLKVELTRDRIPADRNRSLGSI